MPRLACFACGRTLWGTVPAAQLFAEERRCPRCGASLHDDRRTYDRRTVDRRDRKTGESPTGLERRRGDRRQGQRRRTGVA
jgi:ribosomal protein S27AE